MGGQLGSWARAVGSCWPSPEARMSSEAGLPPRRKPAVAVERLGGAPEPATTAIPSARARAAVRSHS